MLPHSTFRCDGGYSPSSRAPRLPRRAGCAPALICASQTLRDQQRTHVLSARSQHAARASIVAARRSLRPDAASARDFFKIEATSRHELPKSERRAIAQLALRRASRSIGFRRVKTDKAQSLARNANCIAIQHLDLTRTKRGSIRNRGDKEKNESETADHR